MKILVIGSGAREHALVWKLQQSQKVTSIIAAPGNAGIASIATCCQIPADDILGLLELAKNEAVDLTIVGPEVPLVLGIVDLFQREGLRIFGPNKKASQLEGSKAYAKAFMEKYNIPTADYLELDSLEEAKKHVDDFGYPLVIKADGLAAGKGVIICQNRDDSIKALDEMMGERKFGNAGDKVVFESFLTGIEASMLCFVDGHTITPMTSAQDYKKAFDGDLGLNTGGMGAYSPSILFDDSLMNHINEKILLPFVKGTQLEALDYHGIVFIGLMIEDHEAKVIEFNCRLGDPETQVILPRLTNDLVEVIEACLDERLSEVTLSWTKEKTVGVVLASGGYPEAYEKHKTIHGLELANQLVFHAGTMHQGDETVTNGGRVMTVVSYGDSLEEARNLSYEDIEKIHFDQMMYRKDIAKF